MPCDVQQAKLLQRACSSHLRSWLMETDFPLNFRRRGVQSAWGWGWCKNGGVGGGWQGGHTEDSLFTQFIFIDNQTINLRCLLKQLACSMIVNSVMLITALLSTAQQAERSIRPNSTYALGSMWRNTQRPCYLDTWGNVTEKNLLPFLQIMFMFDGQIVPVHLLDK